MASPMQMEVDPETEAAYNEIQAQLNAFTSPISRPLRGEGGGSSSSSTMKENAVVDYQMDAMEWMEKELAGSAPDTSHETPKRTPLLERSSTPVMSNSSSKRDKPPEPIQTPLRRTPMTPRVLISSTGSPFIYRRYHDALRTYLQSKRSLSTRMDLEQQEYQLTNPSSEGGGGGGHHFTSSLAGQEARAEIEFVRALHQHCWQNQQREEGNLWLLLVMLRKVGLSALVWDDDNRSAHQHSSSQAHFLQQLSYEVDKTPKEVLEQLSSVSAPLGLQRLRQLVQWIQACLDAVKVAPKKSTNLASSSLPDDDDVPQLMREGQSHLLKSCLSYIVAGRVDECRNIARSQGQPWRAAAWLGGEVDGYTSVTNDQTREVDLKPTGNPNRFVWKRQCWKSGERCLNRSPDESAIYSFLANDVHSCLVNPCLRTWECGLVSILTAVWGRIQDQLFHWHNNNRRKCQPPPAGTKWVDQETEQLLSTSTLSGMTERQMVQLLNGSPYEVMRTTGIYETAMAAFLIGKSALLEFCAAETSGDFEGDEEELRFLTHLTLFLDSLHDSATPIDLMGLGEQKNKLLFSYVQHIETRRDLWTQMALYVSLLPEDKIIEFYPTFLVQVVQSREREAMLEQIRELCPEVEVQVLRRVVRLALSSSESDDATKCHSIDWLLHGHYGEALICANILLRDFFMNEKEDKMEAGMEFVDEYLPNDLIASARGEEAGLEFVRASSEYSAFTTYLNAYKTFVDWKDVLADTPRSVPSKQQMDLNYLNPTELSIAQQSIVKDWVREKKTKCDIIVEAAEKARKSIHEVLVFSGGWLAEDASFDENTEENGRQKNLGAIRTRHLALAVNLYHEVCEETALWMSRNLDDAPSIQLDRKKVLELLNDPQYSPSYWYDHALDLASIVAKDENGIRNNIQLADLKELLSKLAETAVSKLMHTA